MESVIEYASMTGKENSLETSMESGMISGIRNYIMEL